MNAGPGFALVASVCYGTGDFLGGWATRRASALTVTFAAGIPGLVTLLVAWPFAGGEWVAADVAWGTAAGVFGSLGVALLFRAYAIGPVSIAAPLISLIALSVPIVVGVMLGERPSAIAITGIALAAAAFPLLARAHPAHAARIPEVSVGPHMPPVIGGSAQATSGRGMIQIAIVSGLLVGGFLVAIGRVSSGAGLFPLVVARVTMLVLFGAILLARRERAWPAQASGATTASGVLDSLANISYFVALHHGALTLIATIISLSPAVTVLLARFVLHEHWTPSQRAGLVLAGTAVVCVSMG